MGYRTPQFRRIHLLHRSGRLVGRCFHNLGNIELESFNLISTHRSKLVNIETPISAESNIRMCRWLSCVVPRAGFRRCGIRLRRFAPATKASARQARARVFPCWLELPKIPKLQWLSQWLPKYKDAEYVVGCVSGTRTVVLAKA